MAFLRQFIQLVAFFLILNFLLKIQYLFLFKKISAYVISSLLVGIIAQVKSSIKEDSYDYKSLCGASNCPWYRLSTEKSKPSFTSVYILCGLLLCFCVIAILITILFVDNINLNNSDYDESEPTSYLISSKTDNKKFFHKLGK